MNNNTVFDMVTERMVAALEAGTVPWQKPWSGGNRARNLISGKAYRGVNILLLQMTAVEKNYTSPYWLSFKQAKELGGTFKYLPGYGERDWTDEDGVFHKQYETGQHGTVIVFWQMIKAKKTDDEPGKMIPLLKYSRVFNLEQFDDIRIPKGRTLTEKTVLDFDPIVEAEKMIAGYQNPPKIVEKLPEAFFTPDTDMVNLPPRESFTDEGEFYSTAFHELTHSTGTKNRLNRNVGEFVFGSHNYGREELVAEMGSAFLCAEAGIESTFDNSAAYLNAWLRTIKEDPRAVVVAAGAAQKATDYILNRSYEKTEEDE